MSNLIPIFGILGLTHSLILILRGAPKVHFTFFGMSGVTYRMQEVALVTIVTFTWFTIAPLLLQMACQRGWIHNIRFWSTWHKVTDDNRALVAKQSTSSASSLLLAVAAIWIPNSDWRLDHAEIGLFFVIATIGCLRASIQDAREMRMHRASNESKDP